MNGYVISAGTKTVHVETFREAGLAVMEAMTGFLELDPEGAAEGVMIAKYAFSAGTGTAEFEINTIGSWSVIITVHGEPVTVEVAKN